MHILYISHLFIYMVYMFTCNTVYMITYILLIYLDCVYCSCIIIFRIYDYMFTSTHVHSLFPINMLFRYSLGCLIQDHMWITKPSCKHVYHPYINIWYNLSDFLARNRLFVCLLVENRWMVRFEPFKGRSVLVLSLISFAGGLFFIFLRRSDVFLIYIL